MIASRRSRCTQLSQAIVRRFWSSLNLRLHFKLAALSILVASPSVADDLRALSMTDGSVLSETGGGQLASRQSVSSDGRFVAFVSQGPDLVAGYTGTGNQVYLFDRLTSEVTLVSGAEGSSLQGANSNSSAAAISSDGALVAFHSDATDLQSGASGPGFVNVYLWERTSGALTLVSHAAGAPLVRGNSHSYQESVSSDGAFLSFRSQATDLQVGSSGPGQSNIYLWERASGVTQLVSHTEGAALQRANSYSIGAVVSPDASYVAFQSAATDMQAGSSGNLGQYDIHIWERASGLVTLVSHAAGNPLQRANLASERAVITASGAFVSFKSAASNLQAGSSGPGSGQAYLWDRSTGLVTLVSHSAAAPLQRSNNSVSTVEVSADGAFVVFSSWATDLNSSVSGPVTNNVYLWQRSSDTLSLVSSAAGSPTQRGNGTSYLPFVSGDGARVGFVSASTDLQAGSSGPNQYNVYVWERASGDRALISHNLTNPLQRVAGSFSIEPVMSGDGSYVAFFDSSSDLVANDASFGLDVFLSSTDASSRVLVSRRDVGAPGGGITANGESFPVGAGNRTVSGDGSYVAFSSDATNLQLGSSGPSGQNVYVWSRSSGAVTLASHAFGVALQRGSGSSSQPVISSSGDFVAFWSTATDLLSSNSGPSSGNIYIWERSSGEVTLVSHASGAALQRGSLQSNGPVISSDGSYVAFWSQANDLLPSWSGPSGNSNVFLWSRETDAMTLVSHTAGAPTQGGNGTSSQMVLSSDGSHVVFASYANDLLSGLSGPGQDNVYAWERSSGILTLVSHASGLNLQRGNSSSFQPVLSGDGRYVVFHSFASDLQGGASGPATQNVYLWDRLSGAIELVSHAGVAVLQRGNGDSSKPVISEDGSYLAFQSIASDLQLGSSGPGTINIYSWERATSELTLVSHAAGSSLQRGNSHSVGPVISGDGSAVAFSSIASDLLTGSSGSGHESVYWWKRSPESLRLVSHSSGSELQRGNNISTGPALSANGYRVAFYSAATDLISRDFNNYRDAFLWDSGPAGGETTLPIDPLITTTEPLSSDWTNDTTVLVAWSGAVDEVGGSGVDGYSIEWNTTPVSTPNSSVDVNHTVDPHSATSPPLADGDGHYFHLSTCDNSGNCTSTVHAGPFWIDTAPPSAPGAVTSSSHGDGLPHADSTIDLSWGAATDALSGLGDYLYAFDNTPAGPCTGGGATAGTSAASASLADGIWYAHVCSTDLAGNSSVVHGGPYRIGADLAYASTLVSHQAGATAITGNGASSGRYLSADGRYVAFSSLASDLFVGGSDANGVQDAFLWDRVSNLVTLISHLPGLPGTVASGEATATGISSDGAFVAFHSTAADMIAGGSDTNGAMDAFLWERATGTVTLISHQAGLPTTAGDEISYTANGALSADGQRVAIYSNATNLVAGAADVSATTDAMMWDRASGLLAYVSHLPGSPTSAAASYSIPSFVSADGEFVAFYSQATNLMSGGSDANGNYDVFLWERATGDVALASHVAGSPGVAGSGLSSPRAISSDGEVLVYLSYSTDLVPGFSNNNGTLVDTFAYVRSSGENELLSRTTAGPGAGGNSASYGEAVSADGRYVLLTSASTDLVPGVTDPNGTGFDVFLRDRVSGTTKLLTSAAGTPAVTSNNESVGAGLSSDGRFALYKSWATDLIAGMTPANSAGEWDVYLVDTLLGDTDLLSHSAASDTTTGNAECLPVGLASGGAVALMECVATDLAAGVSDPNGPATDLYVAAGSAPDSTPPTDPVISSISSPTETWSTDNTVEVSWWGAFDEPGGSGLAGYSTEWNSTPIATPDAVIDVLHLSDPHWSLSPLLADGNDHYFHLSSCDNSGNCTSTVHAGPFWIDTTSPSPPGAVSSGSHAIGVPTTDLTIDVSWGAASDASSGILQYEYAFDGNPSGNCIGAFATPGTSVSNVPLFDGIWYVHVCAVDNVGFRGAVTDGGPFVIDSSAPNPAGTLYFSNFLAGDIRRVGVDGTGETVLVAGENVPLSVAVDGLHGKIYWGTPDAIRRANLDGSNVETVATMGFGGYGIAVDAAGDRLFWIDLSLGAIRVAALDGSGVATLHSPVGLDTGLDIDRAAGKLYWTESLGLRRSNLDGTGIETVYGAGGGCVGVDAPGARVFFAPGSDLRQIGTDGTGASTILSGLPVPREIDFDHASGHLYWVEEGPRLLRRANADGSGAVSLATASYGVALLVPNSDFTPPSDPTIGATSPVASTWSNDITVEVSWSGAVDEVGGSGLSGYSIAWDHAPLSTPDPIVDVAHGSDPHSTTSPALADAGDWYFHLRTCDIAGNCTSTVHAGPFWIDTVAPSQPGALDSASHGLAGIPSSDVDLVVTWGAAGDAGAGVDGYSYFVDGSSSASCDLTKDAEEGTTGVTFAGLSQGTWYVHVCAVDSAGNWGPVRTGGPFIVDSTAPASATTVYYSRYSSGDLRRVGANGLGDAAVLGGLAAPIGLAIDTRAGKLYFSLAGSNQIARCDLDGTNLETLVTGAGGAYGVALDLDGGKVYWAARTAGAIRRANLDGTAVESVLTGLHQPLGVAFDRTWRKVYFTEDSFAPAAATVRIGRANPDGTNLEVLLTVPGTNRPYAIDVDPVGQVLYWVNTSTGTGTIRRLNYDGSGDAALVSGSAPGSVALEPVSQHLFWAEEGGQSVRRARTSGASAVTLSSGGSRWGVALQLPPTAPQALSQAISVPESGSTPLRLRAFDANNDALTWVQLTDPLHGSLSGTAPDLVYTPTPGYFGSDSFTFEVGDGTLTSPVATVSITVTPVDDPPTAPAIGSVVPAAGTWTNDNTVQISWSGAVDDAGGSGLAGYSIEWNHLALSTPDSSVEIAQSSDPHSTLSLPLADAGDWYFHLRACDLGGNCSTAVHVGPIQIDTVMPENILSLATDPPTNLWSADNTFELTWSGATDDRSGVAGYSLFISQATGLPDETIEVVHASDPHHFVTVPLADGELWAFKVRTCDRAGNCRPGAVLTAFGRIDTQAPTSPGTVSSSSHDGGVTNDSTIDVAWGAATDAGSGVASYRIGFTTTPAPPACGALPQTAGDTSASSPPLAVGSWYAHVCAVDAADNESSSATGGPFIIDLSAPRVSTIDSVATSGGAIGEGEVVNVGITQLLVSFDEPMVQALAEATSSYQLVAAGIDGAIDTATCGPLQGDDQSVAIDSAVYAGQTGTLSLNGATALADGSYRLLVCAALEDPAGNPLDGDGNGSGGDDFRRSFRVDLARPTVTLVHSVADTGDGSLGENEATNVAITEVSVSFSEVVLGGDSTASFLLVEGGLDGALDTTACGPLAGDDTSVGLDAAVYSSLGSISTLQLSGGAALADGTYRLLVCGTVTDLGGNALDDDDDDGDGNDDFARNFVVDTVPPTNPTAISSSTHVHAAWSPVTGFGAQWSGATDDRSGPAGYSVVIDGNPTTAVDCTIEVADAAGTGSTVATLGEGAWYVHVRLIDRAGNCAVEEAEAGFWGIDTSAPSAPGAISSSSHDPAGTAVADDTIDVAWGAASDTFSDVASYSYAFDGNPTGSCSSSSTASLGATSGALADGSHYVHVCAVDYAGNSGAAVHGGPYVVDTAGPTGLVASSISHSVSTWSNDNGIDFGFSGATDTSGVAGYAIAFDRAAATLPVCATTQAASTFTGSSSADGSDWWIHVRARDAAGNCGDTVHLGPFWIDTTAPSAPSAVSSSSHGGGPANDPTIDVAWGAATDVTSGVASYSYLFDGAPTGGCPGNSTAGLSATSSTLADGSWYLHVCAVDLAGNTGAAAHGGPYVVDTAGPTGLAISSTSHTVSTWSNDNSVDFSFSGATDASGVSGYAIAYDQASATEPTCAATQTASTFTGSSSPDAADWWMHVRAVDGANNCGGTVHLGPFQVDTQSPAAPGGLASPSHDVGVASNDAMVDVDWAAALDQAGLSGIDGYGFFFSTSAGDACDDVQDVEEDALTTTSGALADGEHFFHLCAVDNAGNWSPVASIGPFVIDTAGASVVAIGTVADTGDGELVEGESTQRGLTQLLVVFDGAMFDASGDSDPADVTNPASYRLYRAGPNGALQTTACGAAAGDDVEVPFAAVSYSASTTTAALSFSGNLALPRESYRLLVCPTLEDDAGTPIAGFTRNFAITASDLLLNPNFDHDLAGWVVMEPTPGGLLWSSNDLSSAPSSGSAEIVTASGTGAVWALSQCFSISGNPVEMSGWTEVESSVAGAPLVGARIDYFGGAGCSGAVVGSTLSPPVAGDTGGFRTYLRLTRSSPPTAALSVLVSMEVEGGAAATFTARFDDLFYGLTPPLFSDGFESNGTGAWSAAVP